MIPDVSITLTGWEAVWVLTGAAFGTYRAIRLLLIMPMSTAAGGGSA